MQSFFRYFKKKPIPFVILLALILGQVICDLTLPTLLSNIITYGLQDQGITGANMIAVQQPTMEHMAYFITEEQQAILDESYSLSDTGYIQSPTGQVIILHEYTYVLQNPEADIDSILRRPMAIVSILDSDPTLIGIQNKEDLWGYIAEHPHMIETINKTFDEYIEPQPQNLESIALAGVLQEYKNIGLNTDRFQSDYLWSQGAKMLLVALLGFLFAVGISLCSAWASSSYTQSLRKELFHHSQRLSVAEVNRLSINSILNRNTTDISTLQQVLTLFLRVGLLAPLLIIGSFIFCRNFPGIAWILLLGGVAFFACIIGGYAYLLPRHRKLQVLNDRVTRILREMLEGLSVIRSFNVETRKQDQLKEANKETLKVTQSINQVALLLNPLMDLILVGLLLFLLLAAFPNIQAGRLPVGTLVASMQYAILIFLSFLLIYQVATLLPRFTTASDRIEEVLALPIVGDPATPTPLPETTADICFNDVSFRYPNAERGMLHKMSFTIPSCQSFAIVGSTGSGKSTLLQLLLRFFEPTEGAITVGGVPLTEVSSTDLYHQMAYIPQTATLFEGSIEDNVRYGNPDATKEEIMAALDCAQATEFVNHLPGKEKALIQLQGANLSGGQKQRIAIARALCMHPHYLVFDDSFAALDAQTDQRLRHTLKQYCAEHQVTLIGVTQKMSFAVEADQVLVIEDGSIVGQGTHKKLMRNNKIYKELVRTQLSKEEITRANQQ